MRSGGWNLRSELVESVFAMPLDAASLGEVARGVSVAVDLAQLAFDDDELESAGQLVGIQIGSGRRWAVAAELCRAATAWVAEDPDWLDAQLAGGGPRVTTAWDLTVVLLALARIAEERMNPRAPGSGRSPVTLSLGPGEALEVDSWLGEDLRALLVVAGGLASHLRRVAWFDEVAPARLLRAAGGPGLRVGSGGER